nr:unnamed protein product [Callosobruchus analis]
MCKMKSLLLAVSLLFILVYVTGMTEKQMWAAVKLARNTCQNKHKASTADIDKMHQGDWNVDHSAMCYMHCALNMYKLMYPNNTFNLEASMKQTPQLPDSFRESAETCIFNCKDEAKTLDDKCVAAYELTKCMYFCNPEKYFLP